MLPQMMPLPWLMVFLLIFLCFFSICLLLNFCFMSYTESSSEKIIVKFFNKMPW